MTEREAALTDEAIVLVQEYMKTALVSVNAMDYQKTKLLVDDLPMTGPRRK